jgi:hypothetical protein
VGARFSAPVQTDPGAHPASCTTGTWSFPGVKSGWGLTLAPYPHLVPWSWNSRAIPLLPLWGVQPVQSLSACTRVHFTFLLLRHVTQYIRMWKSWSWCVWDMIMTFVRRDRGKWHFQVHALLVTLYIGKSGTEFSVTLVEMRHFSALCLCSIKMQMQHQRISPFLGISRKRLCSQSWNGISDEMNFLVESMRLCTSFHFLSQSFSSLLPKNWISGPKRYEELTKYSNSRSTFKIYLW